MYACLWISRASMSRSSGWSAPFHCSFTSLPFFFGHTITNPHPTRQITGQPHVPYDNGRLDDGTRSVCASARFLPRHASCILLAPLALRPVGPVGAHGKVGRCLGLPQFRPPSSVPFIDAIIYREGRVRTSLSRPSRSLKRPAFRFAARQVAK